MANLSNINGKLVVEQTTGYVGIGITDPSQLLHLQSTADTILKIDNITSGTGKSYLLQSTTAGSFVIRDEDASSNRLLINTSGNATFAGTIGSGAITSTSAVTGTRLVANGTGNAIELNQSTTGSATYYVMDNTVETGGKRYRFGYSGSSSDKGSFSIYNQTDSVMPLLLSGANATFAGSITVGTNANIDNNLTVSGGNITLGGTGRIQGVDTVSATTDAANKAYVDTTAGAYLPLAGGTMTGNIVMGDNDITGIDQLIFTSGTFLTDVSSNYVKLHYASTAAGGMIILDGDGTTQGYLYADGGATSNFGLLHGSGSWAVRCKELAEVELRYNNSVKLATTSTGVTVSGTVSATTFSGDLNGTINTVTTATTKGNSTNDTTVATTAFVQNVIGTIPAGLVFQGTWNADTNTPTLTSGSGTTGNFYIVSVAGSTNLDGITDWQVGDWAVFIEQGASDQWEKIDNSSVLSGSGTGGSIAGWSGSGTSVTLGNSPVTFSGNNISIPGTVVINNTLYVTEYIQHLGDTNNNIRFQAGRMILQSKASASAKIDLHDNGSLYLNSGGGTALTLDTSQNATFAGAVTVKSGNKLILNRPNNGVASEISTDASGTMILNSVNDEGFKFQNAGTTFLTLDTSDNATFSGNVGLGGTGLYTSSHSLNIDGTGLAIKNNVNGSSNNWSVIKNTASSSGSNLEFYTSTGKVKIDSFGNTTFGNFTYGSALGQVRIITDGASTPATLSLFGYNNIADGGNYASIDFAMQSSGTGGQVVSSIRGLAEGTGENASDLAFYTATGGTLAERMRITDIGRVVIGGTTASANTLTLVGSAVELDIHNTSGKRWRFNADTSGNLKFEDKTGGTEAMRIASNGNVGIGLTNPLNKLVVSGIDTNAELDGTTVTQAALQLSNSDEAYGTFFGTQSNGTGLIQQRRQSSAVYYNLGINPYGGNVGIGTTSPNAKLHIGPNTLVSGYTPDRSTLAISDTTNGGQLIIRGQSPRIWFDATAGGNAELFLDASKLNILSGNPTSNGSSRFYIKADGNVGIGDTSPDYRLSVKKVNAATPAITVSGAFYGGPRIQTYGLDADPNAWMGLGTDMSGAAYEHNIYFSDYNSNGRLSMGTYNGTTYSEKMCILRTGNVGIGTTTPGAKLQVKVGSAFPLHAGNACGNVGIGVTSTDISGNGLQPQLTVKGNISYGYNNYSSVANTWSNALNFSGYPAGLYQVNICKQSNASAYIIAQVKWSGTAGTVINTVTSFQYGITFSGTQLQSIINTTTDTSISVQCLVTFESCLP